MNRAGVVFNEISLIQLNLQRNQKKKRHLSREHFSLAIVSFFAVHIFCFISTWATFCLRQNSKYTLDIARKQVWKNSKFIYGRENRSNNDGRSERERKKQAPLHIWRLMFTCTDEIRMYNVLWEFFFVFFFGSFQWAKILFVVVVHLKSVYSK